MYVRSWVVLVVINDAVYSRCKKIKFETSKNYKIVVNVIYCYCFLLPVNCHIILFCVLNVKYID